MDTLPSHHRITMFDLGGVLYHIQLQRTRDSLSLLAGHDIDFSLTSQHAVFDEFECGRISAPSFRQGLRDAYGIDATDDDMDAAWNALLVHLDSRSVSWVKHASATSKIILLSNINELHHHRIADECAELFDAFDTLYLSYQMGMRKPQPEILEYVVKDCGVRANEILYLDDSPQHIATAKSMGLQTRQVLSMDNVPNILGIDSIA